MVAGLRACLGDFCEFEDEFLNVFCVGLSFELMGLTNEEKAWDLIFLPEQLFSRLSMITSVRVLHI